MTEEKKGMVLVVDSDSQYLEQLETTFECRGIDAHLTNFNDLQLTGPEIHPNVVIMAARQHYGGGLWDSLIFGTDIAKKLANMYGDLPFIVYDKSTKTVSNPDEACRIKMSAILGKNYILCPPNISEIVAYANCRMSQIR